MIAACKQVASSTAQLVAACKTRTSIGSSEQKGVTTAASAVSKATGQLINAVRSVAPPPPVFMNVTDMESELRTKTGTKVLRIVLLYHSQL